MATAKDPSKTLAQTQMSVDVDAEPWTLTEQGNNDPPAISLSSVNPPSVDAVPGRRNPGAGRRPPQQTKVGGKKQENSTEKAGMKPLKSSPDDAQDDVSESLQHVKKKIEDLSLSTSEDSSSFDSSYGSYDSERDKTKSLQSLDDEIKTYRKELPPHLKAPFIDVLVLYSTDDREEAEKFRLHLVNDIKLPGGVKMQALLYDCPEFTALSGSQLQHLDLAVERSTYVFVYLTKSFVECNWCEISSESCLMKAIYDEEKRWCVVPVYTQKRTSCNFKIPMGLNSLKGINYYNNDEFYRNGVARLVGDKITVKDRLAEGLKIKQKEWIEQYKRDQEQLKNEQLRKKLAEEEITRQLTLKLDAQRQQWQAGNLPWSFSDSQLSSCMPHSLSTSSLKDVQDQNPAVAAYLDQLRNLPYPLQSTQTGQFPQYPLSQPGDVPNPGDAAIYNSNPHAVRRSPSQTSTVSKDAPASLSQIPAPILEKIKDLPPENQQKYIDMYLVNVENQRMQQMREMQSMQMQHDSILNIPPTQPPQNPMFYLHQQQHQQQQMGMYAPQMMPGQGYGMRGTMPGQPNSEQSLSHLLTNAQNLSMSSLSNQVQQGSLGSVQQGNFGSHISQQQVAMATTQSSQIPNMDILSPNSYTPGSVAGMVGENSHGYSTSSSQESYTTRGSSQGHSTGQSMDGPKSSYINRGNLPDSGLFNMDSNLESQVEEDSGSDLSPLSTKSRADSRSAQRGDNNVNVEEQDSLDSGDDLKGTIEKTDSKSKKEKHVVKHYTINIYQAGNVQVGDANIVKEARSDGQEESEDEGDDSDDSEPEESAVTEQKRLNQNQKMPMSRMEGCPSEIHAPTSNPESAAIADAPPSTHSPSIRNPFIPQPGTENFNNHSNGTPSSAGIKPIGTVSPVKQASPPANVYKDDTTQKTVVPSPQTARKTVASGVAQGTESDVDNVHNSSTPAQLLQKADTSSSSTEIKSDSPPVNTVGPCQRTVNAVSPVRPVQSVNPTPNNFQFTTNPTQLFYSRQRMQPQYVELGEDPLSQSQSRDNQLGESEGFTPNTTEPDCDYVMCANDDYESELTEPVNEPARNPTSNGPRGVLGFLSRFSNKVK